MGARRVSRAGVFTDRRASSTVQAHGEGSFEAPAVEDRCAGATEAMRRHDLEVLVMIHRTVVPRDGLADFDAAGG